MPSIHSARWSRGPFTQLEDLPKLERFFRAIILHDEMRMIIEPSPDPQQDEDEDEIASEWKPVFVSFGPTLDGYEDLLVSPVGPKEEIEIRLPTGLLNLAKDLSHGEGNNPYYLAHAEYFQQIANVLSEPGSVICEGEVAGEEDSRVRRSRTRGIRDRQVPAKLGSRH